MRMHNLGYARTLGVFVKQLFLIISNSCIRTISSLCQKMINIKKIIPVLFQIGRMWIVI